ncbi:hypothetical protein [Micrococcus lylae]|uniref:hypothetical protein n=1 Tax=Micrococcus lylae TaxID=1273 RepID=UPI0008341E39|nr:hypothetical protein [Micrococcus lylae]
MSTSESTTMATKNAPAPRISTSRERPSPASWPVTALFCSESALAVWTRTSFSAGSTTASTAVCMALTLDTSAARTRMVWNET